MPLDPSTIAYLDAMGVTAWRRRGPAERARAESPALELVQAADPALASVLIEWRGSFALSDQHPGGALLRKILAALEQPLERFAVYRIAPGETPRCPDAPGRVVLAFTDRPPARPAGGRKSVALPTLASMLADPGAKRVAWTTLRPWIERLAE